MSKKHEIEVVAEVLSKLGDHIWRPDLNKTVIKTLDESSKELFRIAADMNE